MTIKQVVTEFVTKVIEMGEWEELDRVYLTNKVMFLIGLKELSSLEPEGESSEKTTMELMDQLVSEAILLEHIEDTSRNRELLEGQLMDLLTPSPSMVNHIFNEKYHFSPKIATDYFYDLSRENDYIKTREIAKNIEFPVETEYGELLITINLSKPEKDPEQIKAELKMPQQHFPKCMLCIENEGYPGRVGYPTRLNHRVIRMTLDDKKWAFQYSPYSYYNEHAIVFSETHEPMAISRQTFERLINILEVLPHYFVGSNADLPIVGGSILSHDHYQAGRFDFPIEKNPMESEFTLPQLPDVQAGIVKWPMSVIRINSRNKEQLIEAADIILRKWREYSDETLDIIAKTEDGVPHHTITPIARMKGDLFEIDLVLRDNNVSEEYPDGIFHPHREYHHIKKENIGLIEVMGLAILPPRLKHEMEEVSAYLLGESNIIPAYHQEWADGIKQRRDISAETVNHILKEEIGYVFLGVLKDAGVFKRDTLGQEGFQRFISYLITN